MWLIYSVFGIIILLNIFSFITSRFKDPFEDIFFIMSLPGQGKSLLLIKKMLEYKKKNEKLKEKGIKEWAIYSDTPVNIEGVRLFKPLDIAKCWPEEKSVMFIDEISLTWDARKFKQFDEGVSEFMKLHRHAQIVVYCASQ